MKVLAIGNSFSDDAMEYLYPILRALGEEEIILGNLYIGGCSIDRHVMCAKKSLPAYNYRTNVDGEWVKHSEYRSIDAVRAENWDLISMQQASRGSGLVRSYKRLRKLIRFVRKNANKNATLFWHMTWAYQNDSTQTGFKNYDNDQAKMYSSIVKAVQKRILSQKQFAFIVPVGTAIQNARTSYLGDTLTRDGFHMSIPLGRYIAGLTWARVLTGKSVRGISYAPEGVDEKMKAVAIEAVESAVKSPFDVTSLS